MSFRSECGACDNWQHELIFAIGLPYFSLRVYRRRWYWGIDKALKVPT